MCLNSPTEASVGFLGTQIQDKPLDRNALIGSGEVEPGQERVQPLTPHSGDPELWKPPAGDVRCGARWHRGLLYQLPVHGEHRGLLVRAGTPSYSLHRRPLSQLLALFPCVLASFLLCFKW